MKINIMICYWRLELSIPCIRSGLPAISHVIEVTILYSIRVRVKHPAIKESNPKMVGMRVRMIKRNPILTRHSLIDEYRSCKYSSSDWCCIYPISWVLRSEELASHTDAGTLVTVWYRSIIILLEKIIKRAVRTNLYCPIFYILEYLASVCSRRGCPLVPVVRLIQWDKSRARRMDIFLGEPFWSSPPSCRLLESPHRSPPDDPMRYSGFLEFRSREFSIIFLHADTPDSWEYLESCPELISLPYSLYDIVGILAIVVKKNSRSSAIVGEVSGDEWAREGFQENYFMIQYKSTNQAVVIITLLLRSIFTHAWHSALSDIRNIVTLGCRLLCNL